MHATLSPQVTTVEPTLATLRAVLVDAIAADLPERAYQWERAAALLVTRELTPSLEGPDAWYVQAADSDRVYFVGQTESGMWYCTCPDAERRGCPCKHTRCVDLWRRTLARTAADEAGLAVLPARTLPDDRPIPYTLTDRALAALEPQPVA